MMTLEEAISHASEIGKECTQCGDEHRQLAEWLKELRELRKQLKDGGIIMARNKKEQIAYLLKRRYGGMSENDFKNNLEVLYQIGFDEGRDYDIPTMSVR